VRALPLVVKAGVNVGTTLAEGADPLACPLLGAVPLA
jgi:hypothetical protein